MTSDFHPRYQQNLVFFNIDDEFTYNNKLCTKIIKLDEPKAAAPVNLNTQVIDLRLY